MPSEKASLIFQILRGERQNDRRRRKSGRKWVCTDRKAISLYAQSNPKLTEYA